MNEWFPFQEKIKTGQKLLFCFHHAGGSASVYRRWISNGEEYTILPVELPGKATRIKEPFIADMEALTGRIADAVYKYARQKEIYLFGHSMGAAVAFKVAYRLEHVCNQRVSALIVAGRQPPHFPNKDKYRSSMGTDALLKEMVRISGAPDYLLQSKELQDFVLPLIRRDYKLNESFQYNGEKISCDIYAYAGRLDEDAPKEVMRQWESMTSGEFLLKQVEGNHFFVNDAQNNFLHSMLRNLRT